MRRAERHLLSSPSFRASLRRVARRGMVLMLASEFVTGIPDVSTSEWEGSRNY
jgi:hypothetical protein